jgi:hypothetical protein
MTGQTNSLAVNDYQLRLVRLQSLLSLGKVGEYFEPLNHFLF